MKATASAWASIGNVAVGFDMLGQSVDGPADTVTVSLTSDGTIRITSITGIVDGLPVDIQLNTAGRALQSLKQYLGGGPGFEIQINKGIPLGSGLGGSAASAVAALVAANRLLPKPVSLDVLYSCAMDGEAAASGSRHGDNVAPMLLGGLTIAPSSGLPISVPVPDALWVALVHPHFELPTRRAREALRGSYELFEFVHQSENLAMVLAGCFQNDLTLIRRGLRDLLIEPRRADLIPGFASVKQAALDCNALGASISGAGPSVFAWVVGQSEAHTCASAMQEAFRAAGMASDVFVSRANGPAARVISCDA